MPVTNWASRARTLFRDMDGDGRPDPGRVFAHGHFDPGALVAHFLSILNRGGARTTEVADRGAAEGPSTVAAAAPAVDIGPAKIAPVANGDSFTITGNTPFTFTAAQLLGNDVDPDGPEAGLVVAAVGGATHGKIVANGDGTFTFTPETGFAGTAEFTYSVRDAQGLTSAPASPGAATINVSGLVWYVDGNAVAGGDGSFAHPFQSLAPLSTGGAADSLDGAGDTIFVYDRGASAYHSGIVLEADQVLHGDGVALVVNGMSIGASGAATRINHAGAGVTLAAGNAILGVDLVGTAAGAVGIVDGGGTVGALEVRATTIRGQGQILDIDQGGTLDVTLAGASSTGSAGAEGGVIDLQGVQGSFVVAGATSITGTHGQTGIDVTGASGSLAFALQGNVTVSTGAEAAINFSENASGTGTFSMSGASKDIDTTSGAALTFVGNSGATLSITGGGLDIDTTTGTGLEAGGGGQIEIRGAGNHINVGAARAVTVDGTASLGVNLQDVSAAGGATTAIYLSNAGSGGFAITGTGSVAGSGGTIGGVVGSDGSHSAGIGLFIRNSDNVSLANMSFTGTFGNFAIRGRDVDNFTLRDSTLSGTFGTSTRLEEGAIRFDNLGGIARFEGNNISGALTDSLSIDNVAGTLNLLIRDSASDPAIFGLNDTDTDGAGADSANGRDSVRVETSGNANLLMLVDGVTFTGWRGDAVHTIALGDSNHEVTVRNSLFDNAHPQVGSGGGTGVHVAGTARSAGWGVDYSIQDNLFTGSDGPAIAAEFSGGPGTARGMIGGNTIGTPNGLVDIGQAATGGSGGILVGAERVGGGSGPLAHYVTIADNLIRDIIDGSGLGVRATSQSGPEIAIVEATIYGNSVDEIGGASPAAFSALAGGAGPDASRVGLDISNNTFNADSADTFSVYGALLLDQFDGTSANYYFPGYAGDDGENVQPGRSGSEDIEAYLAARGNTMINGPSPLSGNPSQSVYAENAVMNAGDLQPAQTGSSTELPSGASQPAVAAHTMAAQPSLPAHVPPAAQAVAVAIDEGPPGAAELDRIIEAAIARSIQGDSDLLGADTFMI